MVDLEALDNKYCSLCYHCYANELCSGLFSRNHKPYPLDKIRGKDFLVIYLQPNIDMLNNNFDITKRSYGYRKFFEIFEQKVDFFPLVRAIENRDNRPNKTVMTQCSQYVSEIINNNNYKAIIVFGEKVARFFKIKEKGVPLIIKTEKKLIPFYYLDSPSTMYFHSASLSKDDREGDDYYSKYYQILKELFDEQN